MQIEHIFISGIILMSLASIGFFLVRKKRDNALPASLVTVTTLLSYIVMLEGSFVINSGETSVFYTRWIFYIISCSLLMMTISNKLALSKMNTIGVLVLNGLVMLTGTIASTMSNPWNIIVFLVGSLFFIFQMVLLKESSGAKKTESMIWRYIFTGWALFPVIFFLAPEGLGVLGASSAALLYLLLDMYTKIGFYIEIDA